MTCEQFREMIVRQGGVCAANGCDFGERGPQVDHCHDTGVWRGVLCTSCNIALGHARDDVDRLEGLIRYLRTNEISRYQAA